LSFIFTIGGTIVAIGAAALFSLGCDYFVLGVSIPGND
jgi:hypothetical protein